MNQTSGDGGGFYTTGLNNTAICVPVVTNSRITGNSAAYGGGIYIYQYSNPRFTNLIVQGNSAGSSGGGVLIQTYTVPVFENVTIAGNSAGNGGGIDNRGQYLTMTNATISGNRASSYGGGIQNLRGGAVLTNVLMENNYAGSGAGAVYAVIDNSYSAYRSTLVITNGIIRGNKANNGGGIYTQYDFPGTGNANLITHLALTNVLIADNIAGTNGGGIYATNTLAAGTSIPGKGIQIVMNNVTIANNTANAASNANYGGGGIYIPTANAGDANKVTVTANNSVIWGNTAPNNSGRANIFNPTTTRLTITSSAVEDGSYTGTSISVTTPFTTGYYPNTGLVNAGSNSSYPANADILLGNTSGNNGALQGEDVRYGIFKPLIEGAVFTSGRINKDASAAQGDLRYKVTGHGENVNTVTVEPEAKTASTNQRIKSTTIDVGAYEKQ
jgi:predicted outer membrane repeat protein